MWDATEGALVGYPDGAACELPLERQLQVLEYKIRERFDLDVFRVEETFDRVEPTFGQQLLERMTERNAYFPVILVEDDVACTDGVHIAEVLEAVARTVSAPA